MTFSKKVLLFCSVLVLTLVGSPVFAQGFGKDIDAPVRLVNPIGGTEQNPTGNVDTRVIFGSAIRVTLGFLGTFTLAVFFYGGYLWLTSGGSSDKVQKGTQTMLYAVIGLFIIFGAYGILNTVISGILGGATPTGPTITAGTPTVTPEGLEESPSNTPSESTTCDCNLVLDGVDGNGGNCKIGANKVSIDIGDGSGEMVFVSDLFKASFGQQAIGSHCYPLRTDNRQVQNILNARENGRIESPIITKDNCGSVQDEISVADFTAPQDIGGYDGVYGLHLTQCSLGSRAR